MHRGHGNRIYDRSGTAWLDMLSGILNVSLGHGSPIVAVALEEVRRNGLINTYDRPSDNANELRELLAEYDPRFEWRLLNTGAEAIERAIQVAACHFDRPVRVAVLEQSFHGKSLSMAAIRYDVPWGNPLDVVTITDRDTATPFDVLIYEPYRGWDGEPANEERLRAMCNDRGALLVADEMITGFMRCGSRFVNLTADMVISGKGLAQGAPLSVLGMRPHLVPRKFSIGWNTTCGGNNLSATIGLHVLHWLIGAEQAIERDVLRIQEGLWHMGFDAYGALGFKRMKANADAMREVFERNHVIASWHAPWLRVGPSFVTTPTELAQLGRVLAEAEAA